jgi:CCR4-NOT transcription complex subunit 9
VLAQSTLTGSTFHTRSPHTVVSVPVLKHCVQDAAVRILASHVVGSHRCSGQGTLASSCSPRHMGGANSRRFVCLSRAQVDDTDVINFLLSTEIIPLCLRTMEMGSELSKTVATFIVQKILLDDVRTSLSLHGLRRLSSAVSLIRDLDPITHTGWSGLHLRHCGAMLCCRCRVGEHGSDAGAFRTSTTSREGTDTCDASQQEQPSVRLLKHIIRCYLRLSENARARECLRQCFPDQLRDPAFVACLKDDQTTRRWLQQLLVQMGQAD